MTDIRRFISDVPDFPQPGILFRDISPLLRDHFDATLGALETLLSEAEWRDIPLEGGWFPDAFIGRMANLQRFSLGEDKTLVADVEDAWSTMAWVEAAYRSSANPATALSRRP